MIIDEQMMTALKNNLAKFRYMPEETQAAANQIGKKHFKILLDEGYWETAETDSDFASNCRYCLRADYQIEPEKNHIEQRTELTDNWIKTLELLLSFLRKDFK